MTCQNHLLSLLSARGEGDRTLQGQGMENGDGLLSYMVRAVKHKAVRKPTITGKEEGKTPQNSWPQHDACQVPP